MGRELPIVGATRVLGGDARPSAPRAPATWLELALDYRCNLRCIGCHACHDTGQAMATRAALDALQAGRRDGRTRLWIGGGEPTLRADLPGLVRAARALGYDEVLLQTNGMRLSYDDYREAVVAAGITEVRFNVKSHRSEVHDRLSGAPSHALLVSALRGLAGSHVAVSADVLLTRSTVGDDDGTASHLADAIAFYANLGVGRFVLWLLSAADSQEPEVRREVPTFAELVPALREAARSAAAAGVDICSLHTPPCTLPADLRHLFEPAASLGLLVVGPDGRGFPLEDSSFEGGAYLDTCSDCRERVRCGGPRADYLEIHGGSAFSPITDATA